MFTDLFVCSAELLPRAEKAGTAVGLNNMVAIKEVQDKLAEAFAFAFKI